MRLTRESSPLPRLLVLGGGPLALAGLALARFAPGFLLALAHCPLRDGTGVPCPTCGGTLAATDLVRGEWIAAFRANPLVAGLVPIAAVAWLAALTLTLRPAWRRELQLTPGQKRTARVLAVLVLLANWSWLLVNRRG